MWKLDRQQLPRSDFWCFNEWLEWMVLQPELRLVQNTLWTHSVTFRPDISNVKMNFTKMYKHRLWQGPDTGTGSVRVWPVTGACDITASGGAYHPTVLHIYSVLLGNFPHGSMLGVCSFVTWKELQHNEVRESLHREGVLHLWNEKISELREPITPMRHLLNRMCSS